MESNLTNALSVLMVGMITVALLLWLVVVIGHLLIRVTNKFGPLPKKPGKAESEIKTIPVDTLAAIVAAVEVVTGGRGKVSKIEKE